MNRKLMHEQYANAWRGNTQQLKSPPIRNSWYSKEYTSFASRDFTCSSISISKRKHVLSILFQVSAVNPHKTPLQGFFWNKNQISHKKSQNKESESQTKMLDWRMWSWENEILLPSTQQVRKLGVGVLLQKYITTSYYNVPGISSTVALGVRSVTLVPSRHNRI